MSATTQENSLLYNKLITETATLSWQELQPFFARGNVLCVATSVDLIAVAEALAEDKKIPISEWLTRGELHRMDVKDAEDYQARNPQLWAVVVAPLVLVQERQHPTALH